jgi:hypothetical protein
MDPFLRNRKQRIDRMNRTLLTTIWMLAASGFADAQNRGGDAPQVEFRVTRFDPADRKSPTFKTGTASGGVDVEIPLTYIGGPYKVALREGEFLDFRQGEAKQPEISLQIAENERKDLLLLFIPVEQSYKVIKVNTPISRIRGGDRFIINTTQSRMAIKLGSDVPIFIPPGKSEVLRGPGGDDTVSVPVLISLEEDGKWTLASTENWHVDPRFRKYLFAYTSPRNRHLAFHGLTERVDVRK